MSIYMTADIHGDFRPIRDFIKKINNIKKLTKNDVIILLGDSGLQFFFNYRKRNRLCSK